MKIKCGLLTIYVKQKCEKFLHLYKKWFELGGVGSEKFLMGLPSCDLGMKKFSGV